MGKNVPRHKITAGGPFDQHQSIPTMQVMRRAADLRLEGIYTTRAVSLI